MYGKGYSLYVLAVTMCFALSTKATSITRYQFAITLDVDNVKIPYHIGIFSFEYNDGDVVVERDENSSTVKFSIGNANVSFLEGKSRDDNHQEYDISLSGVTIGLKTEGTAQLASDGRRVRNCQFVFSENQDAPNTRVSDVVKEGIFKKLPSQIGRDLCNKIRA